MKTLECPHCKTVITEEQLLKSSFAEDIRKEIEQESNKELEALKLKLKEQQQKEENFKIQSKQNYHKELERIKQDNEKEKNNIFDKFAEMRKKDVQEAKEEQKKLFDDIINSLKEEKESYKRELEAKKEDFEFQKKQLQQNIREDIRKEYQDEINENNLKAKRLEEELTKTKANISNMQDKVKDISSETKGEAFEVYVRDTLKNIFPLDTIGDIQKGQAGADIIQTVKNKADKQIGKILYECKNTKHFNMGWVDKLKNDAFGKGIDFCVIISNTLPDFMLDKNEKIHVLDENFVIVHKDYFGPASIFIRMSIDKVSKIKNENENLSDVKSLLYKEVKSENFNRKIKILKTFHDNIDKNLTTIENQFQAYCAKQRSQLKMNADSLIGIEASIENVLKFDGTPLFEAKDEKDNLIED